MTSDFSYDPVTVTDEVTATGRTAEIFKDIRGTMQIPIVTSIWRALASWDDCLERTWSAVKPIYESGLPDQMLSHLLGQVLISTPNFNIRKQISTIDINHIDLVDIRHIVRAYTRSNALNFLALAAYTTPPSNGKPMNPGQINNDLALHKLKPLLSRAEIHDDAWTQVLKTNSLGSSKRNNSKSDHAHVATLWRHLAHWPSFLSLIYDGFLPYQKSGTIDSYSLKSTVLVDNIGAKIARSFDTSSVGLPDNVIEVITNYVRSPIQVARMVVLGHTVSSWLDQLD